MKNGDMPDVMAFPSLFPIKIFGLAEPTFKTVVIELISPHYAVGENDIEIRYSNERKYVSLTVTIYATSKAQLDAIYLSLTSDKRILMAL